MRAFLDNVKQILNGTRPLNERLKFQSIAALIAAVHLLFVFEFMSFGIKVLMVYNIFIVAFYIGIILLLAVKDCYEVAILVSFAEIMFHSTFATLLLGFDWGFMLYTISLIPTAFYMCFTLPRIRRALTVAISSSIIVCACYFITLAFYENLGGSMTFESDRYANLMYYNNTVLAFCFIVVVSILFSIEVKYMKTTLEKENMSLEQEAMFDPLTKLHNRRSMDVILETQIEKFEETRGDLSLIMADIDDFKVINDTYGHNQGDIVLQEIANVIVSNVREKDAVCRWGGEEMLVLLPVESNIAEHIAERIRRDVENLDIVANGIRVKVTLTLGVAEYHSGMSVSEFVDKADKRLYYGKNHGKNIVVNRNVDAG